MCWGVCITRRGMVYFGASIHIFVSLILFIGASIRAYHLSTYEKEDGRKEILGGGILATYFFILLMLGCLIFRATEQKNPKMLGWTSATFITLETFAFVFNLMILSPMGIAYDDYGLRNFGFTVNIVYIVVSCIVLLAMMAYCATIIMYISKLKEDGTRNSSADYTREDAEDGGEAASTNALSRASSRTTSAFFPMAGKEAPGDGGGGGGAAGMMPMSILDVIRESKKSQNPPPTVGNTSHPPPKKVKRPMTPQQKDVQTRPPSRGSAPASTTTTMEKPPSAMRQQSQSSQSQESQSQMTIPLIEKPPPILIDASTSIQHIPPQPQGPAPVPILLNQNPNQPKFQEQQTQTHPTVPYPPLPPIQHYSQTMPHPPIRRVGPPPPLPPLHHPSHPDYNNFHEYNQRGILSAPSFASMVTTASIAPNRFRNPSALRTTKSGTLTTLGRYDSLSPTPPPLGGGHGGRMQRQTSSSCSYLSDDPNNPNNFDEHWELSRPVQALKYNNYHYNALRRGTHRSDYGVEV